VDPRNLIWCIYVKKILNILDPVLNILWSQKFPEQAIEYVTYMENDLFVPARHWPSVYWWEETGSDSCYSHRWKLGLKHQLSASCGWLASNMTANLIKEMATATTSSCQSWWLGHKHGVVCSIQTDKLSIITNKWKSVLSESILMILLHNETNGSSGGTRNVCIKRVLHYNWVH